MFTLLFFTLFIVFIKVKSNVYSLLVHHGPVEGDIGQVHCTQFCYDTQVILYWSRSASKRAAYTACYSRYIIRSFIFLYVHIL